MLPAMSNGKLDYSLEYAKYPSLLSYWSDNQMKAIIHLFFMGENVDSTKFHSLYIYINCKYCWRSDNRLFDIEN